MQSPTKSCALDPVPTFLLKKMSRHGTPHIDSNSQPIALYGTHAFAIQTSNSHTDSKKA